MTPNDDCDFGLIVHYFDVEYDLDFELGSFFGSELESLPTADWINQARILCGLDELTGSDVNFGFGSCVAAVGDAENSEAVAEIPLSVQK